MAIRYGGVAAIGLMTLCFALPAFGQSDGSTFSINFSATANTVVVGDGYADPYNGTVTYGGSTFNAGSTIICDDYSHNVVNGESWTATGMQASTLSGANITNTRFGSSMGVLGYAEVANLVSQMLSTGNSQQQADLSAAIWWITSGGAKVGSSYTFNGVTLDANAASLLSAVLSTSSSTLLAALAKDTNLWILTPTAGQGGSNGSPQEMWVSTPEGGATLLYLLLAAASCFGAMSFSSRIRTNGRETA
jgi:hypothetical protein